MEQEPSQEELDELFEKAFGDIDESKILETERSEDNVSQELAQREELNWLTLDQLNRESKSLENQRYKDDTEHRKKLTTWAGVIVSFWLLAVLLILIGNTNQYKLDDSVLITLLGTTTLNVLGLMVIVLSDIFNKRKKE